MCYGNRDEEVENDNRLNDELNIIKGELAQQNHTTQVDVRED